MKLADCGLWIDASLLLNFRRPAAHSYRSLKIDHELIDRWAHDYPYYTWLLGHDGEALETVQLLRDVIFKGELLGEKPRVSHRSGFDLTKLFEEAGGKVALASHESPTALEAIATYCGLKNPELFPLRSKATADLSFQKWNRRHQKFTYVLERGLHLSSERKIVEQLADTGILLNIRSYMDLRTTVSGAMKVICDKGFKDAL